MSREELKETVRQLMSLATECYDSALLALRSNKLVDARLLAERGRGVFSNAVKIAQEIVLSTPDGNLQEVDSWLHEWKALEKKFWAPVLKLNEASEEYFKHTHTKGYL